MIEYKLSAYKAEPDSYLDRMGYNRPTWYELTEEGFVPKEDDFERLIFKIDGVEYTSWSDEFQHAWLLEALKK